MELGPQEQSEFKRLLASRRFSEFFSDEVKLGANGLLLQYLGESGSVTVGNGISTGSSTSFVGVSSGGLTLPLFSAQYILPIEAFSMMVFRARDCLSKSGVKSASCVNRIVRRLQRVGMSETDASRILIRFISITSSILKVFVAFHFSRYSFRLIFMK
jgi:hypothetical protein